LPQIEIAIARPNMTTVSYSNYHTHVTATNNYKLVSVSVIYRVSHDKESIDKTKTLKIQNFGKKF